MTDKGYVVLWVVVWCVLVGTLFTTLGGIV